MASVKAKLKVGLLLVRKSKHLKYFGLLVLKDVDYNQYTTRKRAVLME